LFPKNSQVRATYTEVQLDAYPRLTAGNKNNLDEESGLRLGVAGQATLKVWDKKECMHRAVMTRWRLGDCKTKRSIKFGEEIRGRRVKIKIGQC
jgi:hypothetical protein